jgi:uncharacterized protein (TIGR04255 family)
MIESAPPAEFQERIRGDFPFLERAQPAGQWGQLSPDILKMLNIGAAGLQYSFLTEDRKTTLSLAPDSISLSTTDYTRWEHFRRLFQEPHRALIDTYRPNFFTRIGLRYSNVIRREALELSDVAWSKLLRPEILGELVIPEFEQALDNVANRALKLKLPNGSGAVLLRHGLATVAGTQSPSDPSYTIDMDFSNETRKELSDAEPILDKFHELAGRAFRWAISDVLYNALGPIDADTGQPQQLRIDSP